MNRTDELSKFAAALAKAQGAIESASKDRMNPHFRASYADFNSIRNVIQKPLSDNGLAFLQFPRLVEKGVEVETLVIHESGEWVSEILTMPLGQMTPQAIGSALSYCKRYALQAIVGVGTSDDDDGNVAESVADKNFRPEPKPAAQKREPVHQPSMQEKEAESKGIRDEMIAEIEAIKTKADAAKWALANEARKGFLFSEHYKHVSEAFKKKIGEFAKPAAPKQPEFIDFENLRSLVSAALGDAADIATMRERFKTITGPHWDSLLPPDQEDLQRMLRHAEAAIHDADDDGVLWSDEETTL